MTQKEDLTLDLKKMEEELDKAQKQAESWKIAVLKLAGARDYIKIQISKIEEGEKISEQLDATAKVKIIEEIAEIEEKRRKDKEAK